MKFILLLLKMLSEILEKKFIEMLVEEGIDVTTKFTPQKKVIAQIIAKEDGIAAGVYELKVLFETFKIDVLQAVKDGERFKDRDILFILEGDSHKILNVERTALNIFSRMCGIATLTNKFCEIAKKVNPNIRIAATRKTTPLFRYFEKRAIEIGGGDTHRMDLEDNVLIKDNHLTLFHNNVEDALKAAIKSASFTNKVEIEVRSKEDALKAAKYAEIIMFDNMNPDEIAASIREVRKKNKNILFEVSGGIDLGNVAEYARTGADVLSIGALTHSARQIDMALKIVEIKE